jgi:hypothetical protein
LKTLFTLIALLCAATLFAQNNSVLPDTLTAEESYGTEYFDENGDPLDFAGPADTTQIEVREFSEADIEKLKADPDLNYTQPPTVAETLWDRFLKWLSWLLDSIFNKATTTDLGRFLMYTVAIILTIVVIMMLLKVNAFKVFYSGADKGKLEYGVFHENIHEMNFEILIREATEKKEYRLATRLIFLFALKVLSDKHLIDFKAGKTNHDYVEELQKGEIKTGLNELSFYFDYAWYGNFAINESQFQKVNNTFASWMQKIK